MLQVDQIKRELKLMMCIANEMSHVSWASVGQRSPTHMYSRPPPADSTAATAYQQPQQQQMTQQQSQQHQQTQQRGMQKVLRLLMYLEDDARLRKFLRRDFASHYETLFAESDRKPEPALEAEPKPEHECELELIWKTTTSNFKLFF